MIPRTSSKGGAFGPVKLRETVDVPIVEDNLVCVQCARPLGDVEWTVVSSPFRKGIVAFACKEHISYAMNLLAKALEHTGPVPEGLTLPNPSEN